MTKIEVALPEWLQSWLEEKGEAVDEFLSDIELAALEGLADGLEIASYLPPGPPTGRPNDPVRIAAELFLGKLLKDAADRLREDSQSSGPPRRTRHGESGPPQSTRVSNIDQVQGVLTTTAMLKKAADERERRQYLLPQDWDLERLPNQRLADLQELGFVSGDVTAHTWLLGDTLETGVVPALWGAVDSLTPADIAFGEMDMGYDDLRWVSDDVLGGLTVNAAAMSAGLTSWAAAVSELVEQRRRELEAYRLLPAPAARRDSPPGGGPSGGGLSWDEGLDLYQRRSGETAENIEWIRTRPDDKAGSGPNEGSTFRDIVRDAVTKSGEDALFAMGGMVPGSMGAPVPAVVHGGERIVGSGNGGGVPINLEVHVHGTVISEGDLAKNVRDGLMRRLA